MRLALLGVRGSTPAPGAPFVRYGGHTSCVAVMGAGEAVPSLVLDAGTGLRELPRLMAGRPFRGLLVLSHLHWDHVQGLPFSPAVDHPEARVDLVVPGAWDGPGGDGAGPRRLLARAMSPPHFPIGPEGLMGAWRFLPAPAGPLSRGGAVVRVAPVAHKGGVTLGIRVELDGTSMAYLPDHVPGSDPATEGLVAGVDVLLHDGQFLDSERERAQAYGHATIGAALRLADRCDVGRLVLTHHAPDRSDDELDALAAAVTHTPGGRPVSFARQGDVLQAAGVSGGTATRPRAARTRPRQPARPR